MKNIYILITALLLTCFLSACAAKGPILLSINYQTPEEGKEAASRRVVTISPLEDSRGKEASIIGLRTTHDLQNDLVVQDTVSKTVTDSLKKAFEARGVSVKDAGKWDLTDRGIKKSGADIQIGGEITTLWIESKALMVSTNMRSTVKLRIVIGDVREKKIIRTINVASALDEDALYSDERLEQQLSETLTSAVNQILNDEELKKRMK